MSPDAAAFLLSVSCGAALCLLWDMFHGLRTVLFKGPIMNAVLDAVWWICAAVIPVWCLWNANSMTFRFFELLGAVMGAFLYYITVSRVLRRIFCVFFAAFLKIFKIFLKILLTPAVILYKMLVVLFLRPLRYIYKRVCRKNDS